MYHRQLQIDNKRKNGHMQRIMVTILGINVNKSTKIKKCFQNIEWPFFGTKEDELTASYSSVDA